MKIRFGPLWILAQEKGLSSHVPKTPQYILIHTFLYYIPSAWAHSGRSPLKVYTIRIIIQSQKDVLDRKASMEAPCNKNSAYCHTIPIPQRSWTRLIPGKAKTYRDFHHYFLPTKTFNLHFLPNPFIISYWELLLVRLYIRDDPNGTYPHKISTSSPSIIVSEFLNLSKIWPFELLF